jgi:hypothetical protein
MTIVLQVLTGIVVLISELTRAMTYLMVWARLVVVFLPPRRAA